MTWRTRCTCGAGAGPMPVTEHDDSCPAYGAGARLFVPVWALVTERRLGPRESRVVRTVLTLASPQDALTIAADLRHGRLRPKPGVVAWVIRTK